MNEQSIALLRLQWSPEQVASSQPFSHETFNQLFYTDKTYFETVKNFVAVTWLNRIGFFARPFTSWELGGNENFNGLFRE